MSSEGEYWAQLVCTTDTESDPVLINKDKFTIGRARGCDLSIGDNKMVSGSHCFIQRNAEGQVILTDTSTNGVLLNQKTILTNGMSTELTHGDEIHIVFINGSETMNIAYLFQDATILQEEQMLDKTESYSDLEPTLTNSDPVQCHSETQEGTVVHSENKIPFKKRKVDPIMAGTSGINSANQENTTDAHSLNLEVVQSDSKQRENAQRSSCTSGTETGKYKHSKYSDPSSSITTANKTEDLPSKDDFEETLMCTICQEILHDCISLQPCMHSFCSGCYSSWMEKSSECPSCRLKVERINKNHIVNNLVDAYLKSHPEKRRPEDDIKELDGKNKITRDMLYPKRKRRNDSDYSDDDSDSDSDSDSFTRIPLPFGFGSLMVAPTFRPSTLIQATQAPGFIRRTVCRQCPGYQTPQLPVDGNNSSQSSLLPKGNCEVHALDLSKPSIQSTSILGSHPPSTSTTAVGSANTNSQSQELSTSATTTTLAADGYVCTVNQNHIICQCCYHPMPDRRHERAATPNIPAISCSVCWRNFCHLYWGCSKPGCAGCIGKFKDFNFADRDLQKALLDNEYESNILKNYLTERSLTFKDVLLECGRKLDAKEYSCMDQARGLSTSDCIVCYSCGLKNFKEMLYQYRKSIPKDQLPASVNARSDCYWGKQCRTQKNKAHHAQNFNHVCEQTRFM